MAPNSLQGPNGEGPGAHTGAVASLSGDSSTAESPGLQDPKNAISRIEESSPPDEGMCRPHSRPTPASVFFK